MGAENNKPAVYIQQPWFLFIAPISFYTKKSNPLWSSKHFYSILIDLFHSRRSETTEKALFSMMKNFNVQNKYITKNFLILYMITLKIMKIFAKQQKNRCEWLEFKRVHWKIGKKVYFFFKLRFDDWFFLGFFFFAVVKIKKSFRTKVN